jgi:hypothetical protein
MAQINPVLPDVLENRYASEHVGGAFNAKNIPKPKSTEQALLDATFGRKPEESLMLEGQDTRRYIKHDEIIAEIPSQVSFGPRGVQPVVVNPTARPSRKSVAITTVSPGQNVRTPTVSSKVKENPLLRTNTYAATVIPGQNVRTPTVSSKVKENPLLRTNTYAATVIPGQNVRTPIVSSKVKENPLLRPSKYIASVTPGQITRVALSPPIIVPGERTIRPTINPSFLPQIPGQGGRSIARRPEPAGSGKPSTPVPRGFSPKFVPVFGPLVDLPQPVYWNTDPDIWDISKLVGQTFWDHQ